MAEVEHSLGLARTLFERRERLWAKKFGSEVEYLQAKSNKEGLEKRLATLQEQLALAKITAPIAGTVDEVRIKEGEMAAAGMPAFRLVQMSRLKIAADVSESLVGRIKRGDPVSVSLPSLDRVFYKPGQRRLTGHRPVQSDLQSRGRRDRIGRPGSAQHARRRDDQ